MARRSALGASPAHGPPVSDPEQVNPPGNVTAETQGSRLRVRWAPPVSAFPGHCFDYEVRLRDSRKGSSQVTDAAARPPGDPGGTALALPQAEMEAQGRWRESWGSTCPEAEVALFLLP